MTLCQVKYKSFSLVLAPEKWNNFKLRIGNETHLQNIIYRSHNRVEL